MKMMRRLKRREDVIETPTQRPSRPEVDFEKLRRCFVLYSNFRSGTHLLKLSMNEIAGVRACPEPFNGDVSGTPEKLFHEFVRHYEIDGIDLISGVEKQVYDFFGSFLVSASASVPSIIDMKYSQAYTLGMNHLLMVPNLLKLFVEWELPIVHLIRRDTVAQAVSHVLALETGEFIRLAGDAASSQAKRYWLDPEQVLQSAKSRKLATDTAQKHLDILGARTLTIFYEDLIAEDWAAQYQRVFRFIDHYAEIPAGFEPPSKKQNSASRVSNLDEIYQYIAKRQPDLIQHYPASM